MRKNYKIELRPSGDIRIVSGSGVWLKVGKADIIKLANDLADILDGTYKGEKR